MREFMNDVRGGLSIIRHVPRPVAILVVLVTVVDFGLAPRDSTYLQDSVVQKFILENQGIGIAFSFLIVIAALIVPIFYTVEFARIGVERRSGSGTRLRYFPNFKLIWVSVFLLLVSIVVMIFVSITIYFINVLLHAAAPRFIFGYNFISEFLPFTISNPVITVFDSISLLVQFLSLTAIVFLVSRFALIPIMIWNQDLAFRTAWRRQIDVFDQYRGSVRARFFWIFLGLSILAVGFDLFVAMVLREGWAAQLLMVPVSFILLVVLPVAVLTHMVHRHPVPEPVVDDTARTDDVSPGRGNEMNALNHFEQVAAHAAADISHTPEEAIVSRRSVRGFLPDPVPMELVRHILEVSARAPSGTNMQPWQGHVMVGAKLKALCDAVRDAHFNSPEGHEKEYKYYPDAFFEPFLGRRRKVGLDLYRLAGVAKGDTAKMREQSGRNYLFFDAPVGMMFTIDKRLEIGSWLDYGMFLQNIMTIARQYGLHTCPQAAWPTYHTVIKQQLGIADDQTVVCGIALGYEDTSLVENSLRTEREPVDGFMTFHTD